MKFEPKRLRSLVAWAFLALVPAVASAELAVTTQDVNMRAGPDVSYPRVAVLGGGVQVDVMGCVEGYQWCDVTVGPNRGWVAAGYLAYGAYGYRNAPTVIAQGGPMLGIPLVSFSIAPYWDSYYRGRPWWNNRGYWYDRERTWRPPYYANQGPDRHYGRGNDWRGYEDRGNRGHGYEDRGNRGHGYEERGNRGRGEDNGRHNGHAEQNLPPV